MKRFVFIHAISILLGLWVTACSSGPDADQQASTSEAVAETSSPEEIQRNPLRNVYFGDTHFHTAISGDAYGGGTRLTQEEAYRLAIGEAVESNTGQMVQLERPLDFLVITDHAEGYGFMVELSKGNEMIMADTTAKRWYDMMNGGPGEQSKLAVEIPWALANNKLPAVATDAKTMVPIMKTAWQSSTALAEKYNRPGSFTAMIGYEWTSVPSGNNLHRNVFFRDGKDKADQIIPFSAMQSEDPEKLWAWLENYEQKTGGKILAIPHNGNLSGGLMFSPNDHNGNPITAEYAQKRAQWEPLFEIAQIKGVSETHPALSPNDEYANFGIAGWDNGNLTLDILITPEQRNHQYLRQALANGMRYEEKLGVNPFKYGIVGASDSHTAIPSTDEDNWWGKHISTEPSPKRITEISKKNNGVTRYGYEYQSNGYTAVWAEANTRADIWDALKRKETYGTTGTRISLRLFGGYDFSEDDLNSADFVARGYRKGVPMGGDLPAAGGRKPRFMIYAMKDPNWANLDRIQVIKCWYDRDKPMEKIYDVAWSGNRKPDARGKVPAVGNTVNLDNATYTNDIGAPTLQALWEDPDFDPAQRVCYYVRVMEIPSPTWQLYDKVKYHLQNVPKEVPLTHQERAWSSPIWYTP